MKDAVYVREAEVEKRDKASYIISYYRLTIVDKAHICNEKLIDELFESLKSDILEWHLNRLRKKHKRLETSIEDFGNIAKVTFTLRAWLRKN